MAKTLLQLAGSLSILTVSSVLQADLVSLRGVLAIVGCGQVFLGLLWSCFAIPAERRERRLEIESPTPRPSQFG